MDIIYCSVLKLDDALRQTEEWNVHRYHAKAVKVCYVPQEKPERLFEGVNRSYL